MNIMNSRDFDKDPYLKQLNIDVAKNEMMQIKGIERWKIDLDYDHHWSIVFQHEFSILLKFDFVKVKVKMKWSNLLTSANGESVEIDSIEHQR